ncbi:hypothetical protein LXL04_030454 [Taraxacum kok-saghyz]
MTRNYANYFKEFMNDDPETSKKGIPMMPIADAPMTPLHEVGFAHHLLDKMLKINIRKFTTSSDPSSSFSGFDIPEIPDLTKGDTLKSLKLKLLILFLLLCFVALCTVSAGLIGTKYITLPLNFQLDSAHLRCKGTNSYKLLHLGLWILMETAGIGIQDSIPFHVMFENTMAISTKEVQIRQMLESCLRERGQKWKLDYLDKLKKKKHTRIVYAHNYLSCLAMYFFTFITNNNVLIILS